MKYKIIIIVLLLSLLLFGYLIPATPVAGDSAITAASGSAADIQAAIDTVYANGGGIVYIPGGIFNLGDWVLIRDRVSLIGAGMEETILHTQGSSMVIQVEGNNIRISGFSLVSTDGEASVGIRFSDCVDFRTDHIYIEGFYNAAIAVHGIESRGVIDHCEIKGNTGPTGLGYGVSVGRDDFWQEDMHLGTAQATFIEDCVFRNTGHAVAAGLYRLFRRPTTGVGILGQPMAVTEPSRFRWSCIRSRLSWRPFGPTSAMCWRGL